MRATEAHKRNVRHTKARVAGGRRYGKPAARDLREWKKAERAKLREQFAQVDSK